MINCVFENGGKGSLRHVAVHAIVEKDGKLLLTKRALGLLEGGKWSMPSGFMNRDETAAQCIVREVKEETGWTGKVECLFKINTDPNRPKEDRQNITLEFIIKPIKQVGKPDKKQTEIKWIPMSELSKIKEFAFDHGETIGLYLKYRKKKYQLPLVV